MASIKKIPDNKVEKFPVQESGEKLVKINSLCPKIVINNTHPASIVKEETQYLRKSATKNLCLAQKELEKIKPGYKLMVSQAFRSMDTQTSCNNHYYKEIKEENPNVNKEKLKEITDNFVAPPESTPPHTTGGAVDVTIMDKNNNQIDMGTDILASTEKSSTLNKDISNKAEENRKLLIKIMEKAGFVNYSPEWWHWTYGDKYWALVKGKTSAIYDTVKELPK